MIDVVVLTDSRYLEDSETDQYKHNVYYEDELVVNALKNEGFQVLRLAWDDKFFDWTKTRFVLFRSTWDYFDRFNEFFSWLNDIAKKTTLLNSNRLINWNIDKHYLLDLKTKGFKDILSMQFSVNWDPSVLKFQKVQNPQIPGINDNSFGLHILDQGKLTFLWFDMNLQPRTIKDEGFIYQLCFEPIGCSGASTKLKISSNPTAKEVTNKQKQVLQFTHAGNTITIK